MIIDKGNIKPVKYPGNPRIVEEKDNEKLGLRLDRLGDLSGITINVITNRIVTGNRRTDHIPLDDKVIFERYDKPDEQGTVAIGAVRSPEGKLFFYREVEWDEETEREANIVGNVHAGKWDTDILREKWDRAKLLSWGMRQSDLKQAKTPRDYNQREPIPPDQRPKIYSRSGDVFMLNDHRIVCGDSTDPEQVITLLAGGQIDIVCTDPPYNVGYEGKWDRSETITNDKMAEKTFGEFLAAFYSAYVPHCKPGSPWYVFHADLNGHQFRQRLIDAGVYLSQCLIWDKMSSVISRNDYHWQHEAILHGWVKDETIANQIKQFLQTELGLHLHEYEEAYEHILYGWTKGAGHPWYSDRMQKTIIEFPKPTANPEHPTIKPVGLLEYLLNNSARAGDVVCDPFTGSGSGLLAADRSDMIFRGMELEEKHMDTIIRYWVRDRIDRGEHYKVLRNGKDITRQRWIK